jgi:xylulose-5-phosphate/fructose-6-phosphate phosphoketolase
VRGYAEEGTTTTPFDLLAMNGVDRFTLAIDALSRADISVSEMVRGMSGEFAIRSVSGARDAIEAFAAHRDELRRYVREAGDDPPEIKEWVWPSGEPVSV